MNSIILAASAPLQSVLSRVRTVDASLTGDASLPVGGREAELRILLAFVLLGAVVAAATVLLPAGVFRQQKGGVG